MAKSRQTLLDELSALVRSNGAGGLTSASDVRTFLTSLVDEMLDRAAAPEMGSGTVVRFATSTVYPYLTSGTWGVDIAGRRAGVVATVTLGAGVTHPALDPAIFILPPTGGQFRAGKEHLVMFMVTADLRIVYTVTPLS